MIRIPWSMLRGIGNSGAAKATILIPLVGYLFLFNGQFVTWLQLHPAVGGVATEATQAAFGWRLLCLYYGLMLVAIATVVYAVRCPYVCKRYADAVAYALDTHQIHSSAGAFAGLIGELRDVVGSSKAAPAGALQAAKGELLLLGRKDADANAWDSIELEERPSRVQRLLTAKYNLEDHSRRWARRIVVMLYAIGLVLLALPSGNLFFEVSRQTVRMLLAQ